LNWEQTIQFIRTKPEYKDLVEKAYFEENLPLNVERFRQSEEFQETKQLLKQLTPNARFLLDIGSGNGISAVSFALEGYDVVTVEPDPSNTIGAGAIRQLKAHYNLSNLEVYESFAEDIKFPGETFDIVYSRQCMHHAYDLARFVSEAFRVLKKSGIFITVRDHVVYDQKDKDLFLEAHPLHKFYGGENAFTLNEYEGALKKAGFTIEKRLGHY
jgi:ubiquinone/menaquinone biosynthesis C-methylase UbiE